MRNAGLVVMALVTGAASASIIDADVDGIEVAYGGFAGVTMGASAFDFGTAFQSIDTVTLVLTFTIDAPNQSLAFTPTIDGVDDPTAILFLGGQPNPVTFEFDLSPAAIGGVLDGVGTLGLVVDSSVFAFDGQVRITRAVLRVDGVVPTPATAGVVAVAAGLLAGRRRR